MISWNVREKSIKLDIAYLDNIRSNNSPPSHNLVRLSGIDQDVNYYESIVVFKKDKTKKERLTPSQYKHMSHPRTHYGTEPHSHGL